MLWTIQCVHTTVVGTALPYYCRYIFKDDEWMYSTLYIVETIVLILGPMIAPIFLKRMSKKTFALSGSILAVVGQVLFMLDVTSFTWAAITTVIRSIGVAQLSAVIFGILGDVVEYGQWKTHVRQESMIFGGSSFGYKVGTGLTSAVITFLMEASGYISSTGTLVEQPQSALDMISAIYIYGPIIVWVIAIIVLLFYRLDKIYPQIMVDLQEREARGEL